MHAPGSNFRLAVDFAQEVELGPQLGAGAFGAVYQASWRGQQVAVKMLPVQALGPSK